MNTDDYVKFIIDRKKFWMDNSFVKVLLSSYMSLLINEFARDDAILCYLFKDVSMRTHNRPLENYNNVENVKSYYKFLNLFKREFPISYESIKDIDPSSISFDKFKKYINEKEIYNFLNYIKDIEIKRIEELRKKLLSYWCYLFSTFIVSLYIVGYSKFFGSLYFYSNRSIYNSIKYPYDFPIDIEKIKISQLVILLYNIYTFRVSYNQVNNLEYLKSYIKFDDFYLSRCIKFIEIDYKYAGKGKLLFPIFSYDKNLKIEEVDVIETGKRIENIFPLNDILFKDVSLIYNGHKDINKLITELNFYSTDNNGYKDLIELFKYDDGDVDDSWLYNTNLKFIYEKD